MTRRQRLPASPRLSANASSRSSATASSRPPAAASRLPRLDARLVRRVLLPLAVVWLIGSLGAAAVGAYFAASAFDRALLDDALGLAASVTEGSDGLEPSLSVDELRAVLFDQSEAVLYALRGADGRLLAGDARLPAVAPGAQAPPRFADVKLDDESLRSVAIVRATPRPFTLVLAQTTRYRGALLRRLLLVVATPQMLLLIVLGVWLRRSIGRDLAPIERLQNELDRRGAADLAPLPIEPGTHEVETLVQAIDALMARLDTALRSQREFSGDVAHELRTPLAGIRALAEYGLASDDPARWREQLEAIAGSQARASRLVDQLLAIAHADEASAALARQPVALDELVRRVVLRAMPRADAAGVDLGAQGLDEPLVVPGDDGLIEGALQNLLDNALRYGRPADGTPPQVTVVLTREPGGATTLAVVDNGPGLAGAEPEALRARWRQGGAGQRLAEGAGLGLAIVARHAELLGATLSIGPGPGGQGATVALRWDETTGGCVHPASSGHRAGRGTTMRG